MSPQPEPEPMTAEQRRRQRQAARREMVHLQAELDGLNAQIERHFSRIVRAVNKSRKLRARTKSICRQLRDLKNASE